jgi:hypothetical protein
MESFRMLLGELKILWAPQRMAILSAYGFSLKELAKFLPVVEDLNNMTILSKHNL